MPARMTSIATRAGAVLALVAALAGCGKGNLSASAPRTAESCAATVLETLGHVALRIYDEGVHSERTGSARYLIATSLPLREAVERGDRKATRAAAQVLVAGGHMTNLRVMRGGQLLADVGGPAVAPLTGTLTGAGGVPIGTYVTSVWSDGGLVAETDGVTGGAVALRAHASSLAVGGSLALGRRRLAGKGTLELRGVSYQYVSFHAESYPSGVLREYLLAPLRAAAARCGASSEETLVNTLSHIASLIYAGEAGTRTLAQIRRVQRYQPLLAAVARRDPLAARTAIENLLTEHIVRLRVYAGARLLSDVGGPYVLAPVRAPLRLEGRTIGSLVLSIQDDEGYLRLARRLAGLKVLMYMGSQLVKNSLGPAPGAVPANGSYVYRAQRFRVVTLNAEAFPSGPLTVRVLIPIPYS